MSSDDLKELLEKALQEISEKMIWLSGFLLGISITSLSIVKAGIYFSMRLFLLKNFEPTYYSNINATALNKLVSEILNKSIKLFAIFKATSNSFLTSLIVFFVIFIVFRLIRFRILMKFISNSKRLKTIYIVIYLGSIFLGLGFFIAGLQFLFKGIYELGFIL